MYLPQHFREERIPVLRRFVREHPFATLVTLGDDGLIASHVPMLWDEEPAPFGTLRGHIARPNPQREAVRAGVDALAIFLGPQAYVSPGWYPGKREHGQVVPTWNYVAVHASGPLTIVRDAAWLRDLVTRLTDVHERPLPSPWSVSDAPALFVERMLAAIVGIELLVARVEGKWKLSQNRPAGDRAAVIAGLAARGDAQSRAVADAMARLDPEARRSSSEPAEVEGRCHCGNLSFVIAIARPLDTLRIGACDCSFCRNHGAKCVADPRARATIRVRDQARLRRYRFGLETADFLVCLTCGVYLGACIEVDGACFSTLNVQTTVALRDRQATVHCWAGETAAARIARRARSWTPTTVIVGDGTAA